jgi:hypothetical protein
MRICFSSGVIFLGNHISNSPSVDLRLGCVRRGHERRPGDTVFRRYLIVGENRIYTSAQTYRNCSRRSKLHLATFRVVPTQRAKFASSRSKLIGSTLTPKSGLVLRISPRKSWNHFRFPVIREQSLRAVIVRQAIGVGVLGITIATAERARAAIRRHEAARHMSVPAARRLRQTLFVDGGRRHRSLRQSQPGKKQGRPYNRCSRTNYLFLPSQFSFWTSLYLSPKHLSLGVAAMWLLNLQSRLGGPAAAIAGLERDHLGSRGYLLLPRTASAGSSGT